MSSLLEGVPPLKCTGDGSNLKVNLMNLPEAAGQNRFGEKPVFYINLDQANEVTFYACLYKNPQSQDSFLVHLVWIAHQTDEKTNPQTGTDNEIPRLLPKSKFKEFGIQEPQPNPFLAILCLCLCLCMCLCMCLCQS